MEIRRITPDYAVSEQIRPEDAATLAEQGFRTVINNRPDTEVPPDLQSQAMRQAVEAAGLTYVDNPVENGAMTIEMVEAQAKALAEAQTPILAYCRSGTRSSIMWALARAGSEPTEALLEKTRQAGYDLGGLAGQIDTLASR